MKQFELSLIRRNITNDPKTNFGVASVNKIEADDLVHLFSQLLILVVAVQREIHEEEMLALRCENDDIPF